MKKIFLILVGALIHFSPLIWASEEAPLDSPELTQNQAYQVSGNWSQLKRGWNVLQLKILNQENKSLLKAQVTVAYDMATMPMNPPNNPIEEKENGVYEKKIFLGMKGDWKFDVTIEKDSKKDTFAKVVNIKK